MSTELTRFIPVNEWRKYHPWPRAGGLRHLIFNAKKNGFDRVICKIGRRVLIDEVEFVKWVREHSEKG